MHIPPIRLTGAAVRALVALVPACLVVIFAGIIMIFGLFLGDARRSYALQAARTLVCFAKILVSLACGTFE